MPRDLVRDGAIGRVLQVIGLGPHRLGKPDRARRGFSRARNSAAFSATSAATNSSSFSPTPARPTPRSCTRRSETSRTLTNRSSKISAKRRSLVTTARPGYMRVDWFTPDGLSTWGDGRTFILGTKGYIELRKYIDVGAREDGRPRLSRRREAANITSTSTGKVGFPFLRRTDPRLPATAPKTR